MTKRQGMEMSRANRIGWVIAIFIAIILVSTFISTSNNDYAEGASLHRSGHSNKISCDNHLWTRYVYIGDGRIEARMEVRMHACWRHAGLKRDPGKVIDKKTSYKVAFYNTAYGDLSGATWVKYHNYNAWWLDNTWATAKAKHIGYRSCLNVVGQKICSPTADFIVVGRFVSPYLSEKSSHSDGSLPRWSFSWYYGEPGKDPGSWDKHVHLCKTMCR